MPSSACDWSSDVCSSDRSEEHTSELQSRSDLVCRLLLEKKKKTHNSDSHASPTLTPRHNPPDTIPRVIALVRLSSVADNVNDTRQREQWRDSRQAHTNALTVYR